MLKYARRHLSTRLDSKRQSAFAMPDLSAEKWSRREKLNPINFANKGKKSGGSSRKRASSISDKSSTKIIAEKLPRSKTAQLKTKDEDSVSFLYRDILEKQSKSYPRTNALSVTDRADSYLPEIIADNGRVDDRAVPLLGQVSAPLDKDLIHKIANSKQTSSSSSALNAYLAKELLKKSPDSFKEISNRDFTAVIDMNAKIGRYAEAQKAFDMMIEHGYKPCIYDYNTLMNAYSNGNQLQKCVEIFERIKTDGLTPDSYSFGTLIKTLTRNRRITDSFRLYSEMKTLGVEISQPVFTTLIKGCTLIKDYNRAWHLFDHMRTKFHSPDELTYSHMIHICAETGNVEKAFGLMADLRNARLYPISATFNSLIYACAKRPEYYRKVFELVAQSREAGFEPSIVTYNYMLYACSKAGDVWRAKALVDEMKQLAEQGKVELLPNIASNTYLLQTISKLPALVEYVCKVDKWADKMDEFHKRNFEARIGLENAERVKQGLRPVDVNEWLLDEKYNPDENFELKSSFGETSAEVKNYLFQGLAPQETIDEMKQQVIDLGQSLTASLKGNDSKEELLLCALIEMYGSFGMQEKCMDVYCNLFDKLSVKKSNQTFTRTALALLKDRPQYINILNSEDDVEEFEVQRLEKAWKVFQDYEKFRSLAEYPETWDELERKYLRVKWQEKGITHGHRLGEFALYKKLIETLTRHNDLHRAVALFEVMIERGHARVSNSLNAIFDRYKPIATHEPDSNKESSADYSSLPQMFLAATPFRLSDFSHLADKVRYAGLSGLEQKVTALLKQAKHGINRMENEILERQAITEVNIRRSKSGAKKA